MIITIKSTTGGLHALPIRANSPKKSVRDDYASGGVIFVSPTGTQVDLSEEEIAELKGCSAVAIDAPAPPAPPAEPPPAEGKKK